MFSDIRAFQELSNDHPGWAGVPRSPLQTYQFFRRIGA
jgi:hypothetical protein